MEKRMGNDGLMSTLTESPFALGAIDSAFARAKPAGRLVEPQTGKGFFD
jgi:hypothetical protein